MTTEGRGGSAAWAKVLAGFVLLVLLPLVLWFMVSFSRAHVFPW
ncbi:hypothetical protein ACF1BS_16675 [Streptomyces sp. NPDC014748]